MVVHETYRKVDGTFAAPSEIIIETVGDSRQAKLIATGEPVEIGSIEKMSKSKRNTVDPDDIIETYGADTARWFMLSDSPPERDVIWSEERVQGAARFVQRLWRMINDIVALTKDAPKTAAPASFGEESPGHPQLRAAHVTLDKVSSGIERLHFNVCLANIREFANTLGETLSRTPDRPEPDVAWALREAAAILVQLIHPMMPHLAEECWVTLGGTGLGGQCALEPKSSAIPCWLRTTSIWWFRLTARSAEA